MQALWQALEQRGEIYLGQFAGWYCVRDEAFYDENELVPGPDGRKLAPTGAEVEWLEEDKLISSGCPLGKDRLLEWYEANPDAVRLPRSRRNEVISAYVRSDPQGSVGFRAPKLQLGHLTVSVAPREFEACDLCLARRCWHNYIAPRSSRYPDTENSDYASFWPADLHVVGKDILRFHAVYWPAFLMAAGLEPPRRVFAHGWWTVEGQKMSKSLGNGIPPDFLVGKYGVDPARYFLLRELPFGNDGDFSHRAVVGRLNADLANDFGNLAQRVLVMINRNCAAAVPEPGAPGRSADERLLGDARGTLPAGAGEGARLRAGGAFHLALEAIWRVVGDANRYVDEQAPWALSRSDPALHGHRAVTMMLAEELAPTFGMILTQPFVPEAAGRSARPVGGAAGRRRSFAARSRRRLAAGAEPAGAAGHLPGGFVEADAAADG